MTVPAWVGPWIGLPFALGGRGPAYDCWGLVTAVVRTRWGVELPSHSAEYSTAADRADMARVVAGGRSGWSEVPADDVLEGDVVELRVLGQPCHVGLVVAPGWMLHTLEVVGSCAEPWASPRWSRRVVAFHRHADISARRSACLSS